MFRPLTQLPAEQLLDTVDLGRDIGRRQAGYFRNWPGLLTLQIKQNDLPVERPEAINPLQEPGNRKTLMRLALAIHESRLPLQRVEIHQPLRSAPVAYDVRCRHVVRYSIYPRPQAAAPIEPAQAPPNSI